MISAAQKKAKENFKKAIAYRKKTGCSLKEAFAHTYGKKVGAIKKAAPKKAAVKKAAPKKNAGFVKTVKLGTKKEVTYTKKSEVKPKKQPVKISGFKNVIGALPVGFKGTIYDIPFKIVNQYDIYNDVSAIMEDTRSGNTITVFDGKGSAKDKAESIVNYVNKATLLKENYTKPLYGMMLKFSTNLQNEVKAFNAGKKQTIKKQPLIVAIPKIIPKKIATKKAAPKKAARKKTLHYAGTMNSQDGKKMYKYSLGNLDNKLINEYKDILGKIKYYETTINMFKIAIKEYKERGLTRYNVYSLKQDIVKFNSIIKELKTHSKELKKHI